MLHQTEPKWQRFFPTIFCAKKASEREGEGKRGVAGERRRERIERVTERGGEREGREKEKNRGRERNRQIYR